MCAFDLVDTVEEMVGQDFLKVIGGSAAGVGALVALPFFGPIGTITTGGVILGSLLGAGAGMAVASEDESDRQAIRRGCESAREQEWQESINARSGLVEMANSMDGYLLGTKLIYALAASSSVDREPNELAGIKEALDGILSVWNPQELKDELQLMFQNPPTFYEVGLMIREGFKTGELEGNKFMESAEGILRFLDSKDIIEMSKIDEEWNAFKIGLVTDASPSESDAEQEL